MAQDPNALGGWSMDENFSETTNTIAAKVPCDPGTVREYADAGWLECRRLASGIRLFKATAVEQVRKVRAERMARRGSRTEAQA